MSPQFSPETKDGSADYGLLTLSRPLGSAVYSSIGNTLLGSWGNESHGLSISKADLSGKAAHVAAFSRSSGGGAGYHKLRVSTGAIVGLQLGQILHKASSKLDAPGAPIWIEVGKRRLLVGIVSSIFSKNSELNLGCYLSQETQNQLMQWVNADYEQQTELEAPYLSQNELEFVLASPGASLLDGMELESQEGIAFGESQREMFPENRSDDLSLDKNELEYEDLSDETFAEERSSAPSVVNPFPRPIIMSLDMAVSLSSDEARVEFGNCIKAASKPEDVNGLCGAVVDLTGDPDVPPYVGHNDTDMVYVGSLAKVYPLLSAFELRRRVTWQAKDMIKIGLSTTSADWQRKVFAELKKGWQPQLNAAFKGRGLPLNQFPDLAKVIELSPDGTAQLREEFLDWIRAALHQNDAAAVGKYIRALSYPYINGVLAAAGFFDPGKKKGLWISGDYNGNDWLPKDGAGMPLTPRWRLPGHAVSNFTGTALQVIRFLGLMAQGKLVDPASSAKMIELLGTPYLKKTLADATPPRSFTSIKGKVGDGEWDQRHCDSAIVRIDRGPQRSPIMYALATLGSPRNDISPLRKLELAYHDCVVARHS